MTALALWLFILSLIAPLTEPYVQQLNATQEVATVALPTVRATPTASPAERVVVQGVHQGVLTEAEMRALYATAGVPAEWVEPLLAIAWCESRWDAGAVGDDGRSRGLHQLWTGWFPAAGYSLDQWADPVVNTKVALYVRESLGRFGGPGGWTCAR